jgi:transcriptional regulator with XRE-family HTH domain
MVEATGSPSSRGDEDLGKVLARLRRKKGLTGVELGNEVGLSQPTISRLERGIGLPNPEDVRKIAAALDADEPEIQRLVALAERSSGQVVHWRPNPVQLASRQHTALERESTSRTFRSFEPALIAGPLQTSEYARAVLSSFQKLMTPGVDLSATVALPQAVSARLRRQEALSDHGRQFHFVVAEMALGIQVCAAEDMAAQIRRLRDISRQTNVSIAIIPTGIRWPVPPQHGFTLLDDNTVTVDLFSNGLTAEDAANGRFYRDVFDSLAGQAVQEIDPIVDRYLKQYLDQSRAAHAEQG